MDGKISLGEGWTDEDVNFPYLGYASELAFVTVKKSLFFDVCYKSLIYSTFLRALFWGMFAVSEIWI